jgi:hypothetical protein
VKHFSLTEWADFARGVVSAKQAALMQKHLDEDCADCQKTARIWSSMTEFARREKTYEPQASALRVALSYFAPYTLASQRRVPLLARCTFDSFETATAGLRSTGPVLQHLMYQCGNVVIDLRMEPKPSTRSVILAGQIVDSGQPSFLEGVPVSLLSTEETWLETTTNQLGEFHFSFAPARHLKLLFGTEGTAVLVLLPDPELGRA